MEGEFSIDEGRYAECVQYYKDNNHRLCFGDDRLRDGLKFYEIREDQKTRKNFESLVSFLNVQDESDLRTDLGNTLAVAIEVQTLDKFAFTIG